MSPTAQFLCVFAVSTAFLASLALTALVRHVARRMGFVDRPDGGRKAQKQAVALGGGIAVALATLTGIACAMGGSWLGNGGLFASFTQPMWLALFAASVLIALLGLIDDAVAMKGRYKLLGQFMVSGMLIAAGLRIDTVNLFGQAFELGWLATPLTLFWLLGAINAINLIDGIDGLAGSVGCVLCLTVAAITFLQGRFVDVVVMLSLAGALMGFLRYNFAPASIYLGDAGSMLVGLVIGVVAIPGSAKSTLAIGLMIPVAVWSIPILDSAAAILRRKLTGQSVFAADRGHLHHSLLSRGWSVRQASMFIALICATTCVSAVLSVIWQNELIAVLTVLVVVLYLIFTQTFGHIEVSLLRNRLGTTNPQDEDAAVNVTGSHRSVQLQGSREWSKLWAAILESADKHQLTHIKLSINIPSLNEVFYGTWDSKQNVGKQDQLWRVGHPLAIDGEKVGSIELYGLPGDPAGSTPSQISRTLDFLEPIEEDIRQIRERIRIERHEVRVGRGRLDGRDAVEVADPAPDDGDPQPASVPAGAGPSTQPSSPT